jgi:hypothetical protein
MIADTCGRCGCCRLLLPQREVGSGNLSGVQLHPTNDFKDKFVAPGISSFTEASISDLSGLQERWLVSFILNSSLVVRLDDATRRTIYNFLRRAEAAFREYGSARQMTLAHLANPNPDAVSEYIIAIGHWEGFLSHAYQAWCLLARGQKILFTPGDGSTMQRLNLLYNRTKRVIRNSPERAFADLHLIVSKVLISARRV